MVLDSDEPRRSFGIKVQNLPVRSTGEFPEGLQVLIQQKVSIVKRGRYGALSTTWNSHEVPNNFTRYNADNT